MMFARCTRIIKERKFDLQASSRDGSTSKTLASARPAQCHLSGERSPSPSSWDSSTARYGPPFCLHEQLVAWYRSPSPFSVLVVVLPPPIRSSRITPIFTAHPPRPCRVRSASPQCLRKPVCAGDRCRFCTKAPQVASQAASGVTPRPL